MSLLATTRAMARAATVIVASASLLLATLPMAEGAAEAQTALAAALAVQVAPGVPTEGVAAFLGKSTTSTGSSSLQTRW